MLQYDLTGTQLFDAETRWAVVTDGENYAGQPSSPDDRLDGSSLGDGLGDALVVRIARKLWNLTDRSCTDSVARRSAGRRAQASQADATVKAGAITFHGRVQLRTLQILRS